MKKELKLTPKQRKFVGEYLIDLNATQAAIRAGYSQKRAKEMGYENLTKPHVQKEVQAAMARREARTEISQDRVLKEYAKLGFVNPKAFFNDDGTIKAISELDDDTAAAIAGLEVKTLFNKGGEQTGFLHKIKLADKKGALDSIGKHLGMFIDKKEVSGPDGGPIQTRAEIVQELLDSVDGATRGLPKPVPISDE